MIITIDGASATGKGTVARRLAQLLGFLYVDTGAMYRAFAYLALQRGVDPTESNQVTPLLEDFDFSVVPLSQGPSYFLGGVDISEAIRARDVTQAASAVAVHPPVRDVMAIMQVRLGHQGDTVFEGRDMGTAVFPDADYKFFLTATARIRARRRYLEIIQKDPAIKDSLTEADIYADQLLRDEQDSKRSYRPLKPAEDAVVIDTSDLTIDQVVEALVQHVHRGR